MKIHRFIGAFDFSQPNITITDPEFVHQIRDVLRLKIGEGLILCDGKGAEAEVRVVVFSSRGVETELIRLLTNLAEPTARVVLYCAVLKRENFDLVVQKTTEIGVQEIVPLITHRTVKLQLKRERLEKIMREAAEKSGRGTVPTLHEPIKFEDAFLHASHNRANYFFDVMGVAWSPKKVLKQTGTVGLFIGPEGGWSPEEHEQAKGQKFDIANLGHLTLRAETAAIIATYLATHG